MRWQYDAVLALSVWLIYLADRLVDVSHCEHGHDTARHRFTGTHRGKIGLLVAGLFTTLCLVTPLWLNSHEFRSGLVLLALAGAYFWATHGWSHQQWKAFLPKEAAVAILFTLGTTVFVGGRFVSAEAIPLLALAVFCTLCFLNCALITRWESTDHDAYEANSLVNSFSRIVRFLPFGCIAVAVASFTIFLATDARLFLPLGTSAALLGWLHHRSGKLSLDALRVLADVVLLTPLCFFLF